MSENLKTVILGDEYDDDLRTALSKVLQQHGAVRIHKSWGLAGSQEMEVLELKVGNDVLEVESETYIGLKITGPNHLVEDIAKDVQRFMKGD